MVNAKPEELSMWSLMLTSCLSMSFPVHPGDPRVVGDFPFGAPPSRDPIPPPPPPEPAPEPEPEPEPVRFIAVGDAGEGNDAQFEVADAMEAVCAERGCDFVVYLGDNFYTDGVESVDDSEFEDKFELPYANLDLPFYVVNGNHDLDAEDGVLDLWKADIYVEYSEISDKWTMPAPYYNVLWGDVELFGLDTTQLVYGDEDQEDWLDGALDASVAPWKIVFGHHPHLSNGAHGHDDNDLWEDAFEDIVCERADLYLSGHDHTLQWLEPSCGVELVVSGAGAKLTPLEYEDNPTFFEDDTHEGFMWLEVGEDLTGAFYDRDAVELFSMTVSR
jgi:tartrate-resistant acid phosphatase type 5